MQSPLIDNPAAKIELKIRIPDDLFTPGCAKILVNLIGRLVYFRWSTFDIFETMSKGIVIVDDWADEEASSSMKQENVCADDEKNMLEIEDYMLQNVRGNMWIVLIICKIVLIISMI